MIDSYLSENGTLYFTAQTHGLCHEHRNAVANVSKPIFRQYFVIMKCFTWKNHRETFRSRINRIVLVVSSTAR